jgi:hypothetical protein
MESGRKVVVASSDDVLIIDYGYGAFRLWPETDTRFIAEDSEDSVLFEFGEDGGVNKIWAEQLCYLEAASAAKRDDLASTLTWVSHAVEKFPESPRAHINLAKVLHGTGKPGEAMPHVRTALEMDPTNKAALGLLFRLRLRRFGWIIGVVVVVLGLLLTARFVRRKKSRTRHSHS